MTPAPHSGNVGTAFMFPKSLVNGVLFMQQILARDTPKNRPVLTLHTRLRGVLSKGGNMHTHTLNNTEWGGGGGAGL